HISELSHKYVQDARQAVKVGDIVKVKVIAVDPAMKRISLSMKAVMPKPPRRPRPRKKKPAAAAQAVQAAQPVQPVPGPVLVEAKPDRPQQRPMEAKKPKPERQERPRKQPQPQAQQPRPPKPAVETVQPPGKPVTMEEKIRLLQEKFGRAR